MKILGITGGVGCGKSTVLHYLEEAYGAFLIECDQVAKDLQEPGEACWQPMIDLFGEQIAGQDQSIDRSAVAKMVFQNEDLRKKLNAIVHPAVKERVQQLIEAHADSPLIVIEAALLIEDGYKEICDELWYIYADEEIRASRLKASRGYSDEKIRDIMKSQNDDAVFRANCDYVIENNGDLEITRKQIIEKISEDRYGRG